MLSRYLGQTESVLVKKSLLIIVDVHKVNVPTAVIVPYWIEKLMNQVTKQWGLKKKFLFEVKQKKRYVLFTTFQSFQFILIKHKTNYKQAYYATRVEKPKQE